MSKVWLVTGASRGIGAEIAKAVLGAGDRLVATARRKESLAALGPTDNVLCVSLDVADEAQARVAVNDAIGRFGRIDVLVNNAG